MSAATRTGQRSTRRWTRPSPRNSRSGTGFFRSRISRLSILKTRASPLTSSTGCGTRTTTPTGRSGASAGSKRPRENQQLVGGPWLHLPWGRNVGALDFGAQADNPIDQLQLRWFDYWLKGIDNGVDREPKVRLFGIGANKWRTADAWPIPGTEFRKYYLHSQGEANTVSGDGWLSTKKPESNRDGRGSRRRVGEAPTDAFEYDPSDPVPSI